MVLKVVAEECKHAAHSDRHAAHRSLCLALMGECDALSDDIVGEAESEVCENSVEELVGNAALDDIFWWDTPP